MKNNYKTFSHSITGETKLNSTLIVNSINIFWFKHMVTDKPVNLIFRLVFEDKQRITLLNKKVFTKDDLELFKGLINNLLDYT